MSELEKKIAILEEDIAALFDHISVLYAENAKLSRELEGKKG